ncbi:MAG: caspase family protein [Lentisphaerota bacterium]
MKSNSISRPLRIATALLSILLVMTAAITAPALDRGPAPVGRWMRGGDLEWTQTFTSSNIIPHYHAIVIGVQNYKIAPPVGWEKLTTSLQDAKDVADILEKQYGFEVVRLFDEQATRAAIMTALDDVAGYGLDDAVLIYYAGHGYYDPDLGEGFWIPVDAKNRIGAKHAKHDWIWNSSITKMLGASQARHILVVADACYGGSLFRGDEIEEMKTKDIRWYTRALAKPSRYLITSGDYERVLDTGARHSIFAQLFINYLQFQDQKVFSASDIGFTLRKKVGEMSGQMVCMGPLHVPTDAGGEFVFVVDKKAINVPEKNLPANGETTFRSGEETESTQEPAASSGETMTMLKDAALLDAQGASRTAGNLAREAQLQKPGDPMVQTVGAYLQTDRKIGQRQEMHALITRLKELKEESDRKGSASNEYARPRVIAFMESAAAQSGADAEAHAQLFKICLLSSLEAQGKIRLVDRENIEDVLQELELGGSDLSDPRARSLLGQLLPASSLLYGKIMTAGKGELLTLNMIDTESSEVQAVLSVPVADESALYTTCHDLAGKLVGKLRVLKPLAARVIERDGNQLTAGIGTFQRASPDMSFAILEGTPAEDSPLRHAAKKIGQAQISLLGEDASTFKASWTSDPQPGAPLWIQEESGAP